VARELESRLPPLTAKSVEQTAASIAVNLAAASSIVPVRRDDPTRERSVFRSNTAEGSVFGQSYLSTSAATTVQYTPQLQMSTDVFVAEKVAYWISNDVQNAELKLDGIGLDPVEVSIRMHGNEAHVAFRTDELQARAALENASTHLKELLQREGLVLTGVSVGTAGAGDSGDREGKPRQGTRQTNISVDSDLAARSGPVVGRSTGGRLDLFV
jgi:flagellar hook-length control protein FliK